VATGLNSTNRLVFGNVIILYGTITVDATPAAYPIASDKTRLLHCNLQCDNATTAVRVRINTDDGTSDTKDGTIWAASASGEVLCNYFIMAI
jgi:hypothetical protein